MTLDQVRQAADHAARLEALEKALADADAAPHSALPISFVSFPKIDNVERDRDAYDAYGSDHGTKAYYPVETYVRVVRLLILWERLALSQLGVVLD